MAAKSDAWMILEPAFMFTRIRLAAILALLAMALLPSRAAAETAPSVMLEDFIHYALTAQVPMAKANGEALLSSGLSDEELAGLVDEDPRMIERFPIALRWAREVPDLERI
ncbi:MAG TPA: hypothetical protein DEO92_00935, partial [Phycisphaerales bacterium]|nr:hypothetical protein [Phycisphaerales bacterium]